MAAEKIILFVIVTPGAKREGVDTLGGRYRVTVRAKAEGGAANERVRELLARRFGLSVAAVRILSGRKSHRKKIVIMP